MAISNPDLVGRTVGHYRIAEKIGVGGMGEVYRAEDTHLDRSVAVKVLPANMVADSERLQRFVQEAKSASALNHPNIIHIYDINQTEDVNFIAMEFVPGRTLGEMIGNKGLPIGEVLKYGIQISDALATAHAAGIVHRDLKPANVMVTEKGLVKVLDFGLAKLVETRPSPMSASTLSGRPQTQEGVVMGTTVYMSPEQAEGKAVDARSDIFTFGSLLYEMLTGRRAFKGESTIGTLAAILHQEPLPLEGVPAELERVITRCLRKDLERRFQNMADVRVALAELKDESDSGKLAFIPRTTLHKRTRSYRPFAVAGIVSGAVLVTVFGWLLVTRRPAGPPLKDISFTQLTDAPGPEVYPTLSPDDSSFVYQSRASGNWDIYFQRVGGKTVINLTKDSPEDDTEPAISPDGGRIAFRSVREGGGIFVMGATGESVKRLTDFGYNPSWSPDGSELACATAFFSDPRGLATRSGQLFIINVASGEKRPFAKLGDVHQPSWSPHGDRIAFWARTLGSVQRDLWTVPATGGEPLRVTDDSFTDWDPVWSPDGRYLYFSSDRGGSMNLWRVPIAERSGKTLGPPEPITTPAPYSGYISLSRDGHHMLYSQLVETANFYKVAFDPSRETILGQPVAITQGSQAKGSPSVSRDGQRLVFTSIGKQEDIFTIRTDGTDLRQVTDDPFKDRVPAWSPDGRRIAFSSDRSGRLQIWTVLPDGSGPRQMTDLDSGVSGGAWSPDGGRYAFRTPGQPGVPGQLFLADTADSRPPKRPEVLPVVSPTGGSFFPMSWSSDGRSLTVSQRDTYGAMMSGIFVYDFDSQQLRKITDFGNFANWLGDDRRLLFSGRGNLYLTDVRSLLVREILSLPPNMITSPTISGDNRLIAFEMSVTEADVWLATIK